MNLFLLLTSVATTGTFVEAYGEPPLGLTSDEGEKSDHFLSSVPYMTLNHIHPALLSKSIFLFEQGGKKILKSR